MSIKPVKTALLSIALTATLFIVGCVILFSTATGARAWNSKTKQSHANEPSDVGAQATPSPRVKAVYFRITPLGIEPSTLTLPAGRYLVAIDNDSGLKVINVNIDTEGGPRLGSANLPVGKRKWRGQITFTPGRYVLTDPNDPRWVGRLTITAGASDN